MKLKAIDTLHVSSVGPENIAPGQEFEVSDDTGKELIERDLASEVKAAPVHANKAEPAPANKSKAKAK
jgi:hypothetical protein